MDNAYKQRIRKKLQSLKLTEILRNCLKEFKKTHEYKDSGWECLYFSDKLILFGFELFCKKSLWLDQHSLSKTPAFKEFLYFINLFEAVYKGTNDLGKKKLLDQSKQHLMPTSDTYPFIHELETFLYLQLKGFKVCHSQSVYEFDATKNNVSFNIECKTLSNRTGDPYRTEGLRVFEEFINYSNLIEMCVTDSIIHFPFSGEINESNAVIRALDFNRDFRANKLVITPLPKSLIANLKSRNVYATIKYMKQKYPNAYWIFIAEQPFIIILLESSKKRDMIPSLIVQVKKGISQLTKGSNGDPVVLFIKLKNFPRLHHKTNSAKLLQVFAPLIEDNKAPILIQLRSDNTWTKKILNYFNPEFAEYFEYFK